MKITKQISKIIYVGLFLFASTGFASLRSGENAEIIPLNKMQAGAQGMIGLGSHSEFNIAGHLDKAINQDSQVRGIVGMGKYGLLAGASYKWTPFPDFENQPAIAFKSGIQVYRLKKSSVLDIFFQPIISKKYKTDKGTVIPYISVPLGVTYYKDESVTPIQFIMGSTYYDYGAEIGLELQNSDSYILFYWNYLFDEIKGTH